MPWPVKGRVPIWRISRLATLLSEPVLNFEIKNAMYLHRPLGRYLLLQPKRPSVFLEKGSCQSGQSPKRPIHF